MEGYSSEPNILSAVTEITDKKSELSSKNLRKYLTEYNCPMSHQVQGAVRVDK